MQRLRQFFKNLRDAYLYTRSAPEIFAVCAVCKCNDLENPTVFDIDRIAEDVNKAIGDGTFGPYLRTAPRQISRDETRMLLKIIDLHDNLDSAVRFSLRISNLSFLGKIVNVVFWAYLDS